MKVTFNFTIASNLLTGESEVDIFRFAGLNCDFQLLGAQSFVPGFNFVRAWRDILNFKRPILISDSEERVWQNMNNPQHLEMNVALDGNS